jgi:glycosyltransferase involved in cell wall biosynthesis
VTAERLRAEGVASFVQVAEPGANRLPRPPSAGQEPSGARVRLLFLGNLIQRKRALELCTAFASLPTTSTELVLGGRDLEPDYAKLVRQRVVEAGVDDRVHFLGPLSAERVAEQLALCDALVLPSALEGYGMVLSEALWASVPVIAARVGAAEQLVNRTGAGLLFDADDQAALGATLTRFVSDPPLRARLRKAACKAADVLPQWRDTALSVRATLEK